MHAAVVELESRPCGEVAHRGGGEHLTRSRELADPRSDDRRDPTHLPGDVFALAVGGARVVEPGADLAIALAVASSVADKALPDDFVACAELGLSIPGDVAVAGFGDHPMSRLLSPPLTSTVWDVDRVADRATGFLLEAITAEGPQATLREVIAPVLVARPSTG